MRGVMVMTQVAIKINIKSHIIYWITSLVAHQLVYFRTLRVCLDRTYFAELKIYCWNHCSKIIFKCVNSIVRPIFNEKVAKKWNLWVHKQYIMHCLRQKSQHLRLLFIKQYMNSNRVLPKRVKKKKKKRKTQTWEENVNPNIHLAST